MPRETAIFEFGGYWIDREPGRDSLYAYSYDAGARKVRRRSLDTVDVDEAKRRLVEAVLKAPAGDPIDPDAVMLAVVLSHYKKHRSDNLPSSVQAARAIALVLEYVKAKGDPALKCGAFTRAMQEGFMVWSQENLGHSAGTISRNLSVVAAAFEFATQPCLVVDDLGTEREVTLMKYAPKVLYGAAAVAERLNVAEPSAREWVPTYAELGRFIDSIDEKRAKNLFRYVIIALNTWARPEAIMDLSVSEQVDFENGLVDLNPPGRRQNKKRRPLIRLTDNLRGWLQHWDEDRPMTWGGEPVGSVKKAFLRAARKKGVDLPKLTRYTLRHFMATQVRKVTPPVDREQRSIWMGHAVTRGSRTTRWYESLDPEYLEDCTRGTEQVIAELQRYCKTSLTAPAEHPQGVLRVIEGGKGKRKVA